MANEERRASHLASMKGSVLAFMQAHWLDQLIFHATLLLS